MLLEFRNFGGIRPGLPARSLGPEDASVAQNLNPKVGVFRPHLIQVDYAGAFSINNPATIYRFSRLSGGAFNTNLSTGWRAYSDVTNLVKWPSNDNLTERTSVTSGTGAYAPRVIDNTGADRLLGVPVPDKPTIVVTPGTYFTADDRNSAVEKAKGDIIQAFISGISRAKVGATYTNNLTAGYLEDGAEVASVPVISRLRVYEYSGFEGSIVSAYTGATAADVAWVRTTRAGTWMQAAASPAWQGGAGTWMYAVRYNAYGSGFKVTSATVSASLTALKLPDGTTPLLSAAQVTELTTKCVEIFDPDGKLANPVVQPLRAAVAAFEAALNARPQGSVASATVTTNRTAAIATCANAIYDAIARVAMTAGPGMGV